MKKSYNNLIIIILASVSLFFFILQQILFHDTDESLFLVFQDLLFMPIEILLVTFILDKVLREREKKERFSNMNILINCFFSETGIDIIKRLNNNIKNIDELSLMLDINETWDENQFKYTIKFLKSYEHKIDIKPCELEDIKTFLTSKKKYIIPLFSNPSLMEFDFFSDMLFALYHLVDELENRPDVTALPDTDLDHLEKDISRLYKMLVCQWVIYLKHLKSTYPYLWSIAIRKNPFFKNRSIIIS